MNYLKATASERDNNAKPRKMLRSNIHLFDSQLGSFNGGGYLFTYQQPYICPLYFRVQDVTIFDFPGYSSSDIYYITSDLTGASNSTFNSGSPSSIIASVARVGSAGPVSRSDMKAPHIRTGGGPLHQVVFNLRDENLNIIKNARFVVTIII
jgi:hypothetical protein